MVNAIGTSSINPLQMLNAVNAFKGSEKVQENVIPETSDGIDINDKNILEDQNIDEIMQVAKNVGEENLSNDDIQYGLTYGRSVIADYII